MGWSCGVQKEENELNIETKRPSKYVGCKISNGWNISIIVHIIFKLLIIFENLKHKLSNSIVLILTIMNPFAKLIKI